MCQLTGRWRPIRVYRDAADVVRVITTEATYERLVQRAFEKIRQAWTGMPAVMIRQLDALAKIMEGTTAQEDRKLLLDQAAMIDRLSLSSVREESDRADIQRAYQAVLRVHGGLPRPRQRARRRGSETPRSSCPAAGPRARLRAKIAGDARPDLSAGGESEDGVDGGFKRTGVPLDLGEEEAPLDSGEEGDGEVVRVQAGPQVSGGVKRSQPVADGG